MEAEAVREKDTVHQLRPDIVTLSGQAEGRVIQLLHLESTREQGQTAPARATTATRRTTAATRTTTTTTSMTTSMTTTT